MNSDGIGVGKLADALVIVAKEQKDSRAATLLMKTADHVRRFGEPQDCLVIAMTFIAGINVGAGDSDLILRRLDTGLIRAVNRLGL